MKRPFPTKCVSHLLPPTLAGNLGSVPEQDESCYYRKLNSHLTREQEGRTHHIHTAAIILKGDSNR